MLLSCAGNEDLHLLTSSVDQELRIELADWDGQKRYAKYDDFKVGSEQQDKYRLISIGAYSGTAGRYGVNIY